MTAHRSMTSCLYQWLQLICLDALAAAVVKAGLHVLSYPQVHYVKSSFGKHAILLPENHRETKTVPMTAGILQIQHASSGKGSQNKT
jgi:hypothetical protein